MAGVSAYPEPCEACGAGADWRPYGAVLLCTPCKRLAGSWCWSKLQGLNEADILPRFDLAGTGTAYDCTLCGYWHWTSNEESPDAGMADAVARLAELFTAAGFNINAARGWSKIRVPS